MVRREFGANLEKMTPANVREFLDRVQGGPLDGEGRFRLAETHSSYEGILRDFFRQVLELPADEAVVPLWSLALELAYADLGEVMSDQFATLFARVEDPDGR